MKFIVKFPGGKKKKVSRRPACQRKGPSMAGRETQKGEFTLLAQVNSEHPQLKPLDETDFVPAAYSRILRQ